MDSRYLLTIPTTVLIILFWTSYAFRQAGFDCPWNQYGFAIATVTAAVAAGANLFTMVLIVRMKTRFLLTHYMLSSTVAVTIYLFAMGAFFALMTRGRLF